MNEQQVMETKKHKQHPLTFGDFVVAVYDRCTKRQARSVVQLAVNAHLVTLSGRRRLIIS
jgi:hypothetical protein